MSDQHVLRRKKDNRLYEVHLVTPLASRCTGYMFRLTDLNDRTNNVILKGKEENEISLWYWEKVKPTKYFRVATKGTWPEEFREET